MEVHVGLDVSLEVIHFCIVDETDAVLARGRAATELAATAAALREGTGGEIAGNVYEMSNLAHWLRRELEEAA